MAIQIGATATDFEAQNQLREYRLKRETEHNANGNRDA